MATTKAATPEAPANSFTFNGATISTHPLTIAEDADINALVDRLPGDEKTLMQRYVFSEYQIGSTVEGAQPVPRVTANDNDAALVQAYAAWGNLPRSFARQWRVVMDAAEGEGG